MGGFFGVCSKEDVVTKLFYGTDYHSHLGTKYGGLAVKNSEEIKRKIHNIENNYFRSKLEGDLKELEGNSGIGVISDTDPQPLVFGSHLGTFGLATVGKINNMDELIQISFKKRIGFSEMSDGGTNPTSLIWQLINQGASFEEGIQNVQESVKGSCSLILLTEKGIYAARDKLGRTPVIIGKNDKGYAITSETCAFPNLDFEVERDLGPGEIVFLTEEGIESKKAPGNKMQMCSFLWVYYGFPASSYENINVENVRYKCGAALAKKDDVDIDFVAGIPDSGSAAGIGFSNEKGVPYKRPIVKFTPTWPRSFMPQNQEMRDLVAKMKLIPIKDLINGQRILFCEDSIVRGTQLRDHIQEFFNFGAKEIHMRPACPPLIYGCNFLNFSRSKSELDLAGRRAIKELEGKDDVNLEEYILSGSEKNSAMIEIIRRDLKLTSLKYQYLDDLVEAIGLPKEKLCTYCWDGVE